MRSSHAGLHGCRPQYAFGDCSDHRPGYKTVPQNHESVARTNDMGQTALGHQFNACLRNFTRISTPLLAKKMTPIDSLRINAIEQSRVGGARGKATDCDAVVFHLFRQQPDHEIRAWR